MIHFFTNSPYPGTCDITTPLSAVVVYRWSQLGSWSSNLDFWCRRHFFSVFSTFYSDIIARWRSLHGTAIFMSVPQGAAVLAPHSRRLPGLLRVRNSTGAVFEVGILQLLNFAIEMSPFIFKLFLHVLYHKIHKCVYHVCVRHKNSISVR